METIRFYQRKGLLEQPTRESGMRRYGSEDLRRLRFIKQAQTAGFTLDEVSELLELDAGTDRSRARKFATARIEVLNKKISELERARDALQRLAEEYSQGSRGLCPFLRSFDV